MSKGTILLRGASAGAGKTFFLAKTYIRLLLDAYFNDHKNDLKYRRILAVTFTNKATAEMKERILRELDVLARCPQNSDYAADFRKTFSCTDDNLQQASKKILNNILHDYSAFSVSTIDSFFQLVLRAFSREIGYYASYQVELDRKAIVDESVDRILDSLDEAEGDQSLLDWLSVQAMERVGDGEKFSSDAVLLNVAHELTDDSYKSALKAANVDEDALYDEKNILELKKKCEELIKLSKKAICEAAKRCEDSRAQCLGAIVSSRNMLEKYLGLYLGLKIQVKGGIPEPTDAAQRNFLTAEGRAAYESWFKKADKTELGDLTPLLDALADLDRQLQQKGRLITTLQTIMGHFYGFGVLSKVRQTLAALMKEKNVLTLDDTNDILNGLISDTDTPFVYEKMGTRFENFLLDEFQDTSHTQWDNFHPLLKESVASAHSNLVVGDPKQSIYRWRNSDASLMTQTLPAHFRDYIDDKKELDTNWRSGQNIVHFNNEFFAFAAEKMDAALAEGRSLAAIYHDVEQKSSREGGYVKIELIDRPEKGSELTINHLELAAIHRSIQTACEKGYSYNDITIVVRTGAIGVEVAEYLGRCGLKVSTSDTLKMSSSFVVRLMIALLTHLDDPNDKAMNYLIRKYLPNYQEPAITNYSLVDICELLLRTIKEDMPERFQQEISYIRCFMDCLHQFGSNGDNSLHAFLKFIEHSDAKISAPPSQDAVNIITIHKVKGLSAPYVIAPFLEKIDFSRVESSSEKIWCAPDLAGTGLENDLKGVYRVQLGKKMAHSSLFTGAYEQERRQEYIDNLNVVYVAFTRPVQVLHVIAENTGEEFPGLLSEFAQEHPEWIKEEDSLCYTYGELEQRRAEKHKQTHVNQLDSADGYPSFSRGERVCLKADAADYFSSENAPSSHQECLNGTLVHDILSRVVYPKDLECSLQAALQNGELASDEVEPMRRYLQSRLDFAHRQGWFPEKAGKYKIRNEATILMPGGRDYRTDRVLDDGTEVIIIDYKTGEKRNSYARQMRNYAEAYRAMGRKRVVTHLWYLSDNEVQTEIYT